MSAPSDKVNSNGKTVLSPELENLLANFEKGSKDNSAKNLRTLIESSPALRERFEAEVKAKNLTEISLLSDKDRDEKKFSGGYLPKNDGGALRVDADLLKAAGKNDVGKNELFCSMIHELKHSSSREKIIGSAQTALDGINAIRTDIRNPKHDYTEIVGRYVGDARERETSAQIEAFNALAERVREKNPKATLKDLYEASPGTVGYFIDKDAGVDPPKLLKRLESDAGTLKLTMPSEANMKVIGKSYFDKNENFDYENYYAAPIIQAIAKDEKITQDYMVSKEPGYVRPEVRIDLKSLELDEGKIEKRIQLPDNKSFVYFDGTERRSLEPGIRISSSDKLAKPGAMASLLGDSADHVSQDGIGIGIGRQNTAAYERLSAMIKSIDPIVDEAVRKLGLSVGLERENLVGASASSAIANGLENPKLAVLSTDGSKLFLADGLQEQSKHSHVVVEEAIRQPVERSLAQVEHSLATNTTSIKREDDVIDRGPRMT